MGKVEVIVVEGSTLSGHLSGVEVQCWLRVDGGGDVIADIFASHQSDAIRLVLANALQVVQIDDLEGVLAAFDDADAGDLVDLGTEGPVAIARLDVDGAESAVLYVEAASAEPDDVRDATERLLNDL